jgi:Tfp pilus assembly PilM family ATPase
MINFKQVISSAKDELLRNFKSNFEHVLAVEVNDSGVRFAEVLFVNKKEPLLKEKIFNKDDLINEEKVRIFVENNQLNSAYCVLIFPLSKCIIKNASFPLSKGEDLRKMIYLQVEKDLPLKIETLLITYFVVNSDDKGFINVVILMARKSDVEDYISQFKKVGLDFNSIIVSAEPIHLFLKELNGIEKNMVLSQALKKKLLSFLLMTIESSIFVPFRIQNRGMMKMS